MSVYQNLSEDPRCHEAIGQAHLWTPRAYARGPIVVRHPNGIELNITRAPGSWLIRTPFGPDNTSSLLLARIPRTPNARGLAGAQADTLRVVGPDARAQLAQVLVNIKIWALSHPGPMHHLLLARQDRMVTFYVQHPGPAFAKVGNRVLPEELQLRLHALKHVFHAKDRSLSMSATTNIWLNMPRTAHEALALRARLSRS